MNLNRLKSPSVYISKSVKLIRNAVKTGIIKNIRIADNAGARKIKTIQKLLFSLIIKVNQSQQDIFFFQEELPFPHSIFYMLLELSFYHLQLLQHTSGFLQS